MPYAGWGFYPTQPPSHSLMRKQLRGEGCLPQVTPPRFSPHLFCSKVLAFPSVPHTLGQADPSKKGQE